MRLHLINGKRIVKDNILEDIEMVIHNGIIEVIGNDLKGVKVIDLKGNLITPGLVDVHVHFREPGFTDKETIKTGSMAAARGGFTTDFIFNTFNSRVVFSNFTLHNFPNNLFKVFFFN